MATKRYTLDEYIAYLKSYIDNVKFPEVHVHATWKPTIADYRTKGAEYLVEAMRRTHKAKGWSDIAQHCTICPDGYIWTGRSLLVAPASATGYNDSDDDKTHPFMFEMIGNFDVGQERLEGEQLNTAVGLTRALVDLFGSKIVFHREINDTGKTCPGSGIDKAEFIAKVNAYGKDDDDLTLTEYQWKTVQSTIQELLNKGTITDKTWLEKAESRSLSVSELSWLNLVLLSRK
ncbi:peptidoglycan recognition family protein [Paenibacillus thailandensis]|uniref:Peptidoglycan recognition family protein n=1 Tax=Paenibacillus thailandensis TaxID=393250 RepID=A0ABW5R3R1_9BACL